MKIRFVLIKIIVIAFFVEAFLLRCATVMTPEGGPKDTLPPVIVRMEPNNFTTNFKEKKVFIEFNEFVQLKDQNKEMYTSPAMKKQPLVMLRGKGVVLTIRDTLKENTTYAIDLGSAVTDNNEGNPLHDMRYVFSTGDKIDSLMCSGYVEDSYKADSVSKAFLWFYIADSLQNTPDYDSTIFLRKPDVIARAKTNGIFIAQNLKPIKYKVYAFADTNDNQLYEPGIDLIGTIDSLVNPSTMPPFGIWFDSLRMYPSAEPQLYFRVFTDRAFRGQRLVEHSRPDCKRLQFYFNDDYPIIDSLELDSIPRERLIFDPRTIGRDTLNVWIDMPEKSLPDTIKGQIVYYKHDSIRQLVKTREKIKGAWKHIESKEEEKERKKAEKEKAKAEASGEEYKPEEKENPFKYKFTVQGDVNPQLGIGIETDFPIIKFDSTLWEMKLMERGKEKINETVKIHFRRDTLNICHWHIDSKWEEAGKYHLYIPKGAMTDIMGYQNDSIGYDFSTMAQEKFATLKVNVSGTNGKKYILQQTDTSGHMQQEKTNVSGGVVTFMYIPAGEIKLRIIEDTNGNGKWDAGDVVKRLQPERSEYYSNSDGEDTFTTKVNWEITIEANMEQIFKPVTMESLQKMLDEREAARLKKLTEELAKQRRENANRDQNRGQNSGGMMGGMGGMGGMMGGMQGMMGRTM
ncbi:MAG: Ig-like domain-containing protein [Alistipes sp.]|nr:Ig-like domain-containing protein [Candidatus Alistipes equi]